MDYLERACHSATANDLFRLKDDSILPERILRSKGRYGHSLFPFWSKIDKSFLVCTGMSEWTVKKIIK